MWKYKIEIKHFLENDNADPTIVGEKIANVLRRKFRQMVDWKNEKHYDEELEEIVEFFENVTGYDGCTATEELDNRLDQLYDWGDADHKCWIG